MKKPIHATLKRAIAAACISSALFSAPALAIVSIGPSNPDSGSNAIVEAINNARTDITADLKTMSDQLEELFRKAFGTLTAEAQQPNIALQDPAGKYQFTETNAENKGQPPVPPYVLISNATQASAALKMQNTLSNKNAAAQRQVLLQMPADSMLDAQNFLGPFSYTTEVRNKAERFVAFASDYAGPLGPIDLEELNKKTELANEEPARKYKVRVYTNAAIRSLWLRNLYDSLNMRVPIAGLAQQSGMSDTQNASASLAEVERYIASRRIKNPDWYKTINEAPSIAVQREAVFILAELQWQLYQLHQDNEKMLQTMTAIGVMNLRTSGSVSTDQDEIKLQQEVEGRAVPNEEDIKKQAGGMAIQ